MASVAEQLRKTREYKGLAIKDAQEATKIRSRYLRALEEGNYDILPGPVYSVGFLRAYARFLELDSDYLLNTYQQEIIAINDINRSASHLSDQTTEEKPNTSIVYRFLHRLVQRTR